MTANYAIHFWTGSHIACGRDSVQGSSERPSEVSCRRCRPAARKAEQQWREQDAAQRPGPRP